MSRNSNLSSNQKLFWYGGKHLLKNGKQVRDWFFCNRIFSSGNLTKETILHYEVADDYILKVCNLPEVSNQIVSGEELKNFLAATDLYYQRVMTQVYNRQPRVA